MMKKNRRSPPNYASPMRYRFIRIAALSSD